VFLIFCFHWNPLWQYLPHILHIPLKSVTSKVNFLSLSYCSCFTKQSLRYLVFKSSVNSFIVRGLLGSPIFISNIFLLIFYHRQIVISIQTCITWSTSLYRESWSGVFFLSLQFYKPFVSIFLDVSQHTLVMFSLYINQKVMSSWLVFLR